MTGGGARSAAPDRDQQVIRDAETRQTPSQRAEIQAAVNRERARCAGIFERAIADLGPPPRERELLAERLERIRRPWRLRVAARKRATPGRLRRCCGICGADDHTAPRHRSDA